MLAATIGLGTKLELELFDENGDIVRPALLSQFETEQKDGTLLILTPIREGILVPVHRGSQMNVIFERKGDLCSFSAIVAERVREGNLHKLVVRPVSEIKKIQRRTFFRFETVLDVRYRIFASLRDEEDVRGNFVTGLTRDISGGGVCLLMKDKPELGSFIEGTLKLDADMTFIGRIVRIIAIRDTGIFKYEIGVMFTDIDNRSRERIISFIFELQRSLLKKGWST